MLPPLAADPSPSSSSQNLRALRRHEYTRDELHMLSLPSRNTVGDFPTDDEDDGNTPTQPLPQQQQQQDGFGNTESQTNEMGAEGHGGSGFRGDVNSLLRMLLERGVERDESTGGTGLDANGNMFGGIQTMVPEGTVEFGGEWVPPSSTS